MTDSPESCEPTLYRVHVDRIDTYCGIDLHARTMYVCILDHTGRIVTERNMASAPEPFLSFITPYREDQIVGVEYIFTWCWLADLCAREQLAFIPGHALYMKAIHGGKAKNDCIDAHKISMFMRGGMFPEALHSSRKRRSINCLKKWSKISPCRKILNN
jgi:hypothetical protein